MALSPPDPASLIADLRRAGLTRADIAQQARVSATTLWRIEGNENRDHLIGTVGKIERLHERVIGKPGQS